MELVGDARGASAVAHCDHEPGCEGERVEIEEGVAYAFGSVDVYVPFEARAFHVGEWTPEFALALMERDAQHFALQATYITLASNVVAAAIQEAALRAQIQATQQIIAADEKSLAVLRDQFRLGFAMRINPDHAVLENVFQHVGPVPIADQF